MSAPDDLPREARHRLGDMRARRLFTSDLSVSEFLLVKEAGFEPVGMVMGTSIYQIAPKIPSLSAKEPGRELTDVTQALHDARQLAMKRMEEEADALSADGIVGVRLTVNVTTDPRRLEFQQYRAWWRWAKRTGFRRPQNVPSGGWFSTWSTVADDQWTRFCQQMGWSQVPATPWSVPQGRAYSFGANVAEFIAVGTAVRHSGGESWRNRAGKPFQSDLSGQDFWLLVRSGYRPVGFVMGNCVYYVPPSLLSAPARDSRELVEYTHALYDAREIAMERLQADAEALGATGVVGVTVSEQEHSWRTLPQNIGNAALKTGEVIELFVIGTAVVPTGGPVETGATELVLSAGSVGAAAKAEDTE